MTVFKWSLIVSIIICVFSACRTPRSPPPFLAPTPKTAFIVLCCMWPSAMYPSVQWEAASDFVSSRCPPPLLLLLLVLLPHPTSLCTHVTCLVHGISVSYTFFYLCVWMSWRVIFSSIRVMYFPILAWGFFCYSIWGVIEFCHICICDYVRLWSYFSMPHLFPEIIIEIIIIIATSWPYVN